MKVVVIGACGHIGSYLVPKLVKGGFKVVAISRGKSKPYINDPAWKMVEQVVLDRNKDEDFAYKVAKMNADIVVDLINFNIEDTKKMVTALKEIKISHYLYCSSIWAHGRAEISKNSCIDAAGLKPVIKIASATSSMALLTPLYSSSNFAWTVKKSFPLIYQ